MAGLKTFIPVYLVFIAFVIWWKVSAGMAYSAADGIYYMAAARELMDGHGYYTRMISPAQLKNKPAQEPPFKHRGITNKPFHPYFEAVVFKIFGARTYVAFFTSFFFYAISILTLFIIALRAWGPLAAWTSSALLASSETLLYLSTTNHGDAAFVFFMMMALLVSFSPDRRWAATGGLFAAGACLARPNGVVSAFALGLAFLAMELMAKGALKHRLGRVALFALPLIAANGAMLSYNYENFGGMFRYYDVQGSDHLYGGALSSYYDVSSRYNAADSLTSRLGVTPGALFGVLARQFSWIYTVFSNEPYQTAVFILAPFWPLIWLREPRIRWAFIALAVGFGVQLVASRNLPTVMRTMIWMAPVFCVAVGVMVRDAVNMATRWRTRSLALAVYILLAVLVLPPIFSASGRYAEGLVSKETVEQKYAQDEWVAALEPLRPMLTPKTAILSLSPTDYLIPWLFQDVGVSIETPVDFQNFLGVLKKVKTDDFLQVDGAQKDIFLYREEECAYTRFPEARAHASLVFKNQFLCVYRLDVAAIRRAYQDTISHIPD